MNVEQLKAEIQKMPEFKGFNWHDKSENAESFFATMEVGNKTFKDSEKNEYLLGSHYHIFIAHMYAGQKGKEFFYLIVYRKSQMRLFRKHNFSEIEYNKLYASGNTVKKVIKSLKGYFTKCDYSFK